MNQARNQKTIEGHNKRLADTVVVNDVGVRLSWFSLVFESVGSIGDDNNLELILQ